ncbi:MAG: prepilin-type N-terminal cleavage/methylation domain-containing protein [Flavobacteriaceae bacterium]
MQAGFSLIEIIISP